MLRLTSILVLIAALLVGCGNTLNPATTEAEARAACRRAGLTEDLTDALIIAFRANQDLGFTFGESVLEGQNGCNLGCDFDTDCFSACVPCANAVADFVYNR